MFFLSSLSSVDVQLTSASCILAASGRRQLCIFPLLSDICHFVTYDISVLSQMVGSCKYQVTWVPLSRTFSLLKSRQIYLSQMLTNQLRLDEGEAACSWNFLSLQILCWDTYSSVSPGTFIVTGFTNKIQFYWFFGKFILKNNLSWISNSLIKVITSWVIINNPCFLTITNE